MAVDPRSPAMTARASAASALVRASRLSRTWARASSARVLQLLGDGEGRGVVGELLDALGDVPGQVADPLEVAVDLEHRRDPPQVGGHRLVQGQDLQAVALDLDLPAVDERVPRRWTSAARSARPSQRARTLWFSASSTTAASLRTPPQSPSRSLTKWRPTETRSVSQSGSGLRFFAASRRSSPGCIDSPYVRPPRSVAILAPSPDRHPGIPDLSGQPAIAPHRNDRSITKEVYGIHPPRTTAKPQLHEKFTVTREEKSIRRSERAAKRGRAAGFIGERPAMTSDSPPKNPKRSFRGDFAGLPAGDSTRLPPTPYTPLLSELSTDCRGAGGRTPCKGSQ